MLCGARMPTPRCSRCRCSSAAGRARCLHVPQFLQWIGFTQEGFDLWRFYAGDLPIEAMDFAGMIDDHIASRVAARQVIALLFKRARKSVRVFPFFPVMSCCCASFEMPERSCCCFSWWFDWGDHPARAGKSKPFPASCGLTHGRCNPPLQYEVNTERGGDKDCGSNTFRDVSERRHYQMSAIAYYARRESEKRGR